MLFRPIAALIVFMACAVPALGETSWTLTTADFNTESVSLIGIDPAGLRIRTATGERVIKPDLFLQIERSAAAGTGAAPFMLHLSGGDHISGEPVSMTGDVLNWKNPGVGEIAIPLPRLIAMTKIGKPLPEGKRTEDIVTLANGDAVHGIISNFANGKVEVKNAGGDLVPLPFDSIESVQFAATPGAKASTDSGYRVLLADGSLLAAASLKLTDNRFEITMGTEARRALPLEQVSAIERVNGPAVFLSMREPSENLYIPFLGSEQDYPAKMNKSVDGQTDLHFGDKIFRRVIGVHSYSRLSWPLDGTYAAFRTQYGIDADRRGADVTVRVLLDDKVVHEQKNVQSGMLSPVVSIDLAGAKKLTLEVDYGENMHVNDHLTWLEPALLRQKPTAKATTSP